AAVRTNRLAIADTTNSPTRKTGTTTTGGASMSIPGSLVMVRGISFPVSHGYEAQQDIRDVSQPEAGARLRDPLRLSGVHLRVPEDKPARLRDAPGRVRARRALRRAEVLEALPLVVPRRWRLP